jgi:sulfatase modifying factor 1
VVRASNRLRSGLLCLGVLAAVATVNADDGSFVNSLGMEMKLIPAGSFVMGEEPGGFVETGGDWDEAPVHDVRISLPLHMSSTEVTNAQFEQFKPSHRKYRTESKWSKEDDEAAIFVTWHEAMEFCEWLSEKEGVPYRLPTEAEWEYACRAGTTTAYWSGETLHESMMRSQVGYDDWLYDHDEPVSLKVGVSVPNPFGLHDMHGNVEEWCLDWYGPYVAGEQVDPVGRASGLVKVTRGGSHNNDPHYLRSANRSGALPSDRSWLIGFRVVQAPMPTTTPLPPEEPPPVMRDVSQEIVSTDVDRSKPHFAGPRPFVKIPEDSWGPLYSFHNHCPALVDCLNGDLIAVWYSTGREWSPELTILASRLRHGSDEWEPASLFFDVPDRNDHASALMRDDDGTIYYFNGTGVAGWQGLATIMRKSTDHGATWSDPVFIKPDRNPPMGVIESAMRTREGFIVIPLDSTHNTTEVLISRDNGESWEMPADGRREDMPEGAASGSRIAGIHAAFVQLGDGTLLAVGRGRNINGHAPFSRSINMGYTWTYSESPFPALGGGQRANLLRLQEGPILFVGFTDRIQRMGTFELGKERTREITNEGMLIKDAAGVERRVHGMFAALSFDDGNTWPIRKLITPGEQVRDLYGHGWTKRFSIDEDTAEPLGYLSSTQDSRGNIHVISSGLHYEFNLPWLMEPMTAAGEAR